MIRRLHLRTRPFRTALCSGLLCLSGLAHAQQRYPVPLIAVQEALGRLGVKPIPGSLQVTTTVFSSTPNPDVTLERAEMSRNHQLELRFRCNAPASCMPFVAHLNEDGAERAASDLNALQSKVDATAVRSGIGPLQLHAGQHVTMVLEDSKMHIAVPVILIDSGHLGEEVRVASLDRKQTFRAVVSAQDMVRGTL